MIFHYIDESGTGVKDARSRYFALASIAVDERDCLTFDTGINQFKRVLIPWAEPEDFEIKGRDLRRGEKFFAKMNWPQREKAMLDLAQLIESLPCSFQAIRLFTTKTTKKSQSAQRLLAFCPSL